MRASTALLLCALAAGGLACGPGDSPPEPAPGTPEPAAPEARGEAPVQASEGPDRAAVLERARAVFAVLPEEASDPDDPISDERALLGRVLYFDPRLSKNHDISCNSCHDLARYGVDGEPTSPGHRGQRGERNSPTVYNAAFHVAQFWDGRAADVEEQAAGPMLNPVEMAMPAGADVGAVLRSIPEYRSLFEAAFPDEADPVDLPHAARAIGAFERRLTTPSRFDEFLKGDLEALTGAEIGGLVTFLEVGCTSCHRDATVGGTLFQKLGAVKPYPSDDPGRLAVTGNEADRQVFKVPSLRNVTETAPYFHDGSIEMLDEAIRTMAEYQLGRTLSDGQVASILAFLESLRGGINPLYIFPPMLPESGPDTPPPDPS